MDKFTLMDIRGYMDLTQEEFAQWLDVSTATIGMIESGQRAISPNIRSKLAHRFEITDDFIEYRRRKSKLKF